MPVFTIRTPRLDASQALVVRRQPGFIRILISSADSFVSLWRFEFADADVEAGALARVMRSLRDAGIDATQDSDECSDPPDWPSRWVPMKPRCRRLSAAGYDSRAGARRAHGAGTGLARVSPRAPGSDGARLPGLEIDVSAESGVWRIAVSGELDLLSAPLFGVTVDVVLAGHAQTAIVDLAAVSFIDAAGLNALLAVAGPSSTLR